MLAEATAGAGTPAPPAAPVGPLSDTDVTALIETYFELESPVERDALFDRLAAVDNPKVDAFLHAMMTTDEDEYMREAAALELARKGDSAAIAAIMDELDDPDDPQAFAQALDALGQSRGPAFYATLKQIWMDPDRDTDQKRQVMLAMEQLDTARALNDFVQLIEATTEPTAMSDDMIEGAMLAFVRQNHRPALPVLTALRERIAASSLDDEERTELTQFIQEGIDLLVHP